MKSKFEFTMLFLYLLTFGLLAISLLKDRQKSLKALKIASRRLIKMLMPFIVLLIMVSVFLYLVPEELIMAALSHDNKWQGVASALGLGSISVMPGFVAFPLCGILLQKGAMYMILSGFSTSLMMVGIVTFPMEKSFFGTRLALIRNIMGLVIALLVAIGTGIYFGELG